MTHLWEKMVKSLLVLHILSIYLIQNYLRTDKKMKKKVKEKKQLTKKFILSYSLWPLESYYNIKYLLRE